MNQIQNKGNLPPPIERMGLFSPKMNEVWEKVGFPEIWECSTIDELGKVGHLDECEFQVLIDKEHGRYYLTAMSVDPNRLKTKIDTLESGEEIVEEDTDPKPTTILYYTEINGAQFKLWQVADMEHRREMIMQRARLHMGVPVEAFET